LEKINLLQMEPLMGKKRNKQNKQNKQTKQT